MSGKPLSPHPDLGTGPNPITIRALKETVQESADTIPGRNHPKTDFKDLFHAPGGVNPGCLHFNGGGEALSWGGKQSDRQR